MGLFGRRLGGGEPPSPPPPPSGGPFGLSGGGHDGNGRTVPLAELESGPFPRRMRLRARLPEYDLLGSWQEVRLDGPQDAGAVRAQVVGAYYKQFGMYRLPDGSETIRWNETTWREIRDQLELLYDPAYQG